MTARIHRREHPARDAVETRVELLFEAAEPVVIQPDIAQDLCGELLVRVEALELFLKVDALHVQSSNAGSNFGSHATGNPGKAVSVVKPVGNLRFGGSLVLRIDMNDSGEDMCRALLVVDLGGHGVNRVDLHRGGKLAQIAIVEYAATGSYFECALLLLLGALDIFAVMNDLNPEEASGNGECPHEEEQAHKPKARQLERHGARCGVPVSVGSKSGLHGRIGCRLPVYCAGGGGGVICARMGALLSGLIVA